MTAATWPSILTWLSLAIAPVLTAPPPPTSATPLAMAPRDTPFSIFFCENPSWTKPCYYLPSPNGICWTPASQPLEDTDSITRLFGYRIPSNSTSTFPPSAGTIASFGPDAGTVCRLYNQPYCEGGLGDSVQVVKPGLAVLDARVAGWPFRSWKCIDARVVRAGACVWD
jgi:hypothetical protein